ncbi:MAG TPA: hypothetical protein VH300_08050 [Thermoleophilaceae bacterium]|jgi:hypothetical protein|nr:hypothetical protein [Thermoleophilaceae bacterium]
MTKRFLLVAVAALSIFAGATVAQGASKPTKHKFSGTLKARVLSGSSYTGIVTGTNGTGAAIIKVTPGKTPNDFKTTATAFYKNGSITATGPNTATPRADGSGTDFAGTSKVTKGTGVFKGATGTLKLTGSSTAADPTYGVFKVTGTVKY